MDNHSRSCPAPLDTPLPTPPHLRFPNFTPPNTPGNEIFAFDEPSSMLASRIMRAQDNPSPPPVSPSSKITFTNDTKLVDVSEPNTPCYLNAQLPSHVVPLLTTPHSPSLLCTLPSHQSPAQPHGDLITFDVGDESTATSKLIPSHYLNLPGPSGSRNTLDASEVVKEDSCKETESPLILHPNTEEAEISQSGEPSTLVRRNVRNRRSTTPHRTFPSIASEESHANSLIETMPQASNARTRVKRKSAKAADVVEPQGLQNADKQQSAISGLEQNNDASNAGHYLHHRLSSLSPTSSHVLNQLVTTSRDETPPFSRPSISTEFTPTTAMQHVDFQKTPSKELIYTRSPQRLHLDQLPSQTTQVRTPARRILAGEAPPSRNKPFNTLPSTSSVHAVNFSLPRTPISCIPSGDSLARRATNATNNSEDTEKTFSAEPLRIGTPRRQLLERSPSKNLPSAQFRTPARRITVEEAPASGSKRSNLFPQTAASSNALNLGVARNPTVRINSYDSPARRMFINDTGTKHTKHYNTLLHSPIRGTAVRSHSEEPSTTKAIVKNRSNSVEPRPQLERLAFSKSTDSRAPPPKLPFPLIPAAISEEPINEKPPGASPVLVSVLKQRTSKIPRIGTKPYARPTRSATNKFLDPVRRVGPPKQTPLLPSSSQSVRMDHTLDERSTQETVSAHPTANPFTTGSKRKRTPDDTLIATKASTTLPSTMSGSITQQATRIIDTVNNATPELSNTPTAHDKSDPSQPPVVVVGDTPEQPSLDAFTEEKQMDDLTPVPGPSKTPAPDFQPAETMESNSTKARRTTRNRTRATPATIMTASRSSQSRRRINNSTTSDTDVFNTMSAVALKALTNSNTVRNQQYIAAKIETEVIRKPGLRPTSPTIKIKTVLQRTQDEMSRERRERAQRRAQRNEEVLEDDRVGTQQQPESPTPIALHLNIDHDTGDSGRCDGHCRGAGDDEDYQPHDPQSKKRKVANGSEHSEARNGRRVKWDKGLYTEVRLDEIQLGARLLHKHQAILKGCLAPTSKKAAQLDTLGNLPTASLPVEDLVEESIVVKKFVYDDDEEPPQPPPPIALATRSKGKKNKP